MARTMSVCGSPSSLTGCPCAAARPRPAKSTASRMQASASSLACPRVSSRSAHPARSRQAIRTIWRRRNSRRRRIACDSSAAQVMRSRRAAVSEPGRQGVASPSSPASASRSPGYRSRLWQTKSLQARTAAADSWSRASPTIRCAALGTVPISRAQVSRRAACNPDGTAAIGRSGPAGGLSAVIAGVRLFHGSRRWMGKITTGRVRPQVEATRGSRAKKKPRRGGASELCAECSTRASYIMPPMSGMPWAPAASSLGSSATMASVVSNRPATEVAFCSARRVTLVGSRIPISSMSP